MTELDQQALQRDFLRAMRNLAATVCVLTCRDADGGRYGMAATAVTSLSLTPPSIVACVNRSSDFYRRVSSAESFCVNLLAEHQTEQSRVFGSPQYKDERFTFGPWRDDEEGPPVLADARASLVCTPDSSMEYGSHAIIVGKVAQVHVGVAPGPLIYLNKAFVAAGRRLGWSARESGNFMSMQGFTTSEF